MLDRTDTLLVLTPHPVPVKTASLELIQALFAVTATGIQLQVRNASPAYLAESRAASSERARTVAEMTEVHAATLETMLATLRSADLDDTRARTSARETAASALIGLRSAVRRAPRVGRGVDHHGFCADAWGIAFAAQASGNRVGVGGATPSTGVGYQVKWRTAPARSSAARSWPCRISRCSRVSGWPGRSTRLHSRSTFATTAAAKPTWLTLNAQLRFEGRDFGWNRRIRVDARVGEPDQAQPSRSTPPSPYRTATSSPNWLRGSSRYSSIWWPDGATRRSRSASASARAQSSFMLPGSCGNWASRVGVRRPPRARRPA